MSATSVHPELPPAVRRVLDAVRARVRAYVWVEGLATLVALVGLLFWAGLIFDWLFEPSALVRKLVMIVGAAGLAWAAYRVLLRRLLVRIPDATAALLLERRFPALGEHLLTAVSIASTQRDAPALHPELVDHTNQAAAHAVANVRTQELFRRGPLVRSVSLAAAMIVSIGLFAAVASESFAFWLERLAMSDQPWPRRVQLEVVGFPPGADGRRTEKLAQDDDFELLVHARTGPFEVPESVEIRYQLADGRRGRDTMIRVGRAHSGRDDFQLFRYEFKRVPGDLVFDVVGGDDRVRDLALHVVERPELHSIELECVYPDYLARSARRLPVTGGMRIPEGTTLVLHAASTKPLTAARVHRSQSREDFDIKMTDAPTDTLRWEYGTLSGDDVLLVTATDIDGVKCREPYRISLAVVPDELPQVAVRLAGIGTAVTPDANIPLVGKVSDDYGLDRVWIDYEVSQGNAGSRLLAQLPVGTQEWKQIGSFDLRSGDRPTDSKSSPLKPGMRLTLTLRASDRNDLSDEARAGSSQAFALDVVTPSRLLALIERRELALRQRFEAIHEKVTDTRNLLNRLDFAVPAPAEAEASSSPDSKSAPQQAAHTSPPDTAALRDEARRRLRISGSLQNIVQSGEEVLGIAEAFDDLHDQLVNNRIDNPDLKSRLRDQIARPLHHIGNQRMPQLEAQVKLVEKFVDDPVAAQRELSATLALADAILVEMRQVLDRMRELESYNEAVALLRELISDQEEVNRQTKIRQKERLQGLFEE